MGKEWDKLDWQAGGGFSKPGIGDRHTNWPSFSATSKYGATNPTCAECGGRLRGAKKCGCVMPHDHWKPIGKRKNPENEGLPDNVTGSGMSSQMVAIQAWHADWLHACYRVLVPGGRLLAFGGSRVYHRMAAAFDDVGFVDVGLEAWNYGSGFPKSMSIGKSIDKAAGKTTDDIRCLKRELQRVFALSNLTLAQLNAGCGFEASGYLRESSTWVNVLPSPEKWWRMREVIGCDAEFGDSFRAAERAVVGESPWSNSVNHFVPGENHKDRVRLPVTAPATDAARTWEGWGTALKPAWEPVIVGRKPE